MKIKDVDRILDCDFYSVEEDSHGNKEVHVSGYFFTNGESVTDNPDEIFRSVEYTGYIVPLAEFLTLIQNDEVDEKASEYKQYWGDLTKEAVKDSVLHYFNGKPGNPLPYSELSLDTPCGDYINISKEDYDAAFRD